eukprot:6228791-Amphidinium_carterae.2
MIRSASMLSGPGLSTAALYYESICVVPKELRSRTRLVICADKQDTSMYTAVKAASVSFSVDCTN